MHIGCRPQLQRHLSEGAGAPDTVEHQRPAAASQLIQHASWRHEHSMVKARTKPHRCGHALWYCGSL